jgi:hypothetical protein
MKAHWFWLILLVLLTPLDDALARATPQPDDAAWAAQNNDYFSAPAGEMIPHHRRLTPALPRGDTPVPSPVPVSPWGAPAGTGGRMPPDSDPVYLFMFLRC